MRLFNYIEQGGPVMYILLTLNIVGFALLFWKAFSLFDAKKHFAETAEDLKNRIKSLVNLDDSDIGLNILKDEVQISVHRLEMGLNTIKIIAGIAPLLGLLGTVVGILSAFQVISADGMNNPSLFADGIATALLTTVGGLIVAIPHLVGYNYLVGALDDYEIHLEKKLVKDIYGKKE